MTRRRNDDAGQPALYDQYDVDVDNLRGTIRSLGQVSDAIGVEIERQNNILDRMTEEYEKGMITINKLVGKVRDIFHASGFSPMTMTLVFIFGVIVFLWLYWKWAA